LRAPPRSERAQGNPAMRPQWDDIAVIQGSILVRIGRPCHRQKRRNNPAAKSESSNCFVAARAATLRVAMNAGAALTPGTRSPKRHHGLVDFVR
jgi:hypothetical protein